MATVVLGSAQVPLTAVTAVEIAIIVLAAAPVLRVLGKPAVSRECRERPAVAAALLSGLLVVGFATSWAITYSADTRLAITCLAALFGPLSYLRSRTAYGAGRGLPPGSLGIGTSLDAITDPSFYLQEAQRHGWVFKMSQFGRPVVCIADLATGFDFFAVNRESLAQANWAFNRLLPGGYVEFMEGDQHRHYRAILETAFGAAVDDSCQSDIRRSFATHLRRLAAANAGGPVALPQVIDRLAIASMLRMVVGLDSDDPRVDSFAEQFARLRDRPRQLLPVPRQLQATFDQTVESVLALGNAIATTGRLDSLHRSVLSEIAARQPGYGADRAIAGNLTFMINDGATMLRRLYGWIITFACDHPEALADIRASVAAPVEPPSPPNDAALRFVAETLRLRESEFIYRVTRRACHLNSYRVPAGWLVRLCVHEAHRRPAVFPDPERFDPRRFIQSFAADDYSPFGRGAHGCFPAPMVVAIGAGFVQALAHYDWRTAVAAPPERINRHWGFWQPGEAFRFSVVDRP